MPVRTLGIVGVRPSGSEVLIEARRVKSDFGNAVGSNGPSAGLVIRVS
jgi:hypothetical protein